MTEHTTSPRAPVTSSSVVGRWQEDPAVRQARGAIAREWDQDLREAEGYRRTSEKLDVTNLLDALCEAVASCAVVGRERGTAAPVAWQLTVDGDPLWNEASFYQTEADARDALDDAGNGNGCQPLYLAPPARAPLPDRDTLAKIIGENLDLNAHDMKLGADDDELPCAECLRMADALLAALPVPPQAP